MYAVYFHEKSDEYFKARGLNASTIKKLSVSEPYFVASYQKRIPDSDTPFRKRGRAYHCLMLEGREQYESSFAVRPETYLSEPKKKGEQPEVKPWNANANVCKEWIAAAEAQGKQVITPDMDCLLNECAAFVPEEHNPFRGGYAEISLMWEERVGSQVIQCKAGVDYLHDQFTGDLKTASHSMGKNVEDIINNKALYEEQNVQSNYYHRGLHKLRQAAARGVEIETDDRQALDRVVLGGLEIDERPFFFFTQFMQSGCPEYLLRQMGAKDADGADFLPWNEATAKIDKALQLAAKADRGEVTARSLNGEREFPESGGIRIFTNADFRINPDRYI